VAEALSRKSQLNMLEAIELPLELLAEFEYLNLGFVANTQGTSMDVEPTLEQEIRNGQKEDEGIKKIVKLLREDKAPSFRIDQEGIVWFKHRLCVSDIQRIKDIILKEVQESSYSIHLGGTKMYEDLKDWYWWYDMKRDIGEYVALCDTCQRVKESIKDQLVCYNP